MSFTRQQLKMIRAGKRAKDGIHWDDIQRLKAEAGFATAWAVECYPAAGQVVDVANMRHIFIMPEAPDWAWKRSPRIVFVDGPVPTASVS